jgi:hypothetical protein
VGTGTNLSGLPTCQDLAKKTDPRWLYDSPMFLLRALLATLLLTRLFVAQELGFEAQTPLELGLVQTLAWYKEAGWLKY